MQGISIKLSLLILVLVHGATASLQAQEKYIDKNGIVIFEASERLFEEVKAANESVTAILSTETNQIASLALIKGFHFKNSLMEEHFNENYIESDLYPKAKFIGNLVDLNVLQLNENVTEVPVQGVLEVRGERKEIYTVLKTQKIGDIISITGEFTVAPSDFAIEIPKIVRNKIAKEVLVKLDFKLAKK
ncbi:YceI family protein [Ulvibacterium sp.]|uniref:YceI family protein n=1 Tax=Ulvibacterium sp. TaxID=2665914 RepID=UPI002627B03F|nr:YceI family protein [Ulvibacterium sp.]